MPRVSGRDVVLNGAMATSRGRGEKPRCEAALDPSKTMTGIEQERWLLDRLDRSHWLCCKNLLRTKNSLERELAM